MAAPTVTAVSPTGGPAAGGTTVTITGTGFATATAASFGATPATLFAKLSATTAVAIAPAGTGSVHVTVTNPDGTSATSSADLYLYDAGLFTEAELRAFDTALADESAYPDADITAAEALIRADFQQICGVSFIPVTEANEQHDGSGTDLLAVDHLRPYSVTALSVDGTAFTATELAELVCYRRGYIIRATLGTFNAGRGNVLVTYKHGHTTVPAPIARVAMMLACAHLIKSDISTRARSYSDGTMTYQLGFPGQAPHWYGIDEVDAVLDRYRENKVVIA